MAKFILWAGRRRGADYISSASVEAVEHTVANIKAANSDNKNEVYNWR